MPTKRRTKKAAPIEDEAMQPIAPKGAEALKHKILSLLRNVDAEQQNEVVAGVLSALKEDRKKQVEDNQAQIDSAKQNLESLNRSIQEGLAN